jgi:ATP-dependent RNA helicase DDX18/HAS1
VLYRTTIPVHTMVSGNALLVTALLLAGQIQENFALAPTPRSTQSLSTSLQVFTSQRSNRRESYDDDFDEDGWLKPSRDTSRDTSSRSDSRRPSNNNNRNNNNNNNNSRGNNNNRGGDNRNNNRRDSPPMQQRQNSWEEKEVDITDTNAHFFSKKSLDDPSLKTNGDLFKPLCQGAGITRPSRIQSMAWPQILNGQHTIVADQTGSGKTLAYLVPLLLRALSSSNTTATTGNSTKIYGAPKLLVLAPTAELADQIRAVCMKISQTVPFNTMVVTATGKQTTSIRDQIRRIQRTPIDVMISTPGRISTILRTRNSGLDLSHLQTIVLDEVDILLIDETFGAQLRTVGEAAPLETTQFVFVTATLPDQIVKTVTKEFPGVVQVRGPGLHRVAPTMKERLIDVSVPSEFNRDPAMCFDIKAKQLLQALRLTRCRRTLIFCNTVESCRTVENLLNRKDRRGQVYEVSAYHNAMTPEARNANLQVFAQGRPGQDDHTDYVLICTERAARGVDFDAAPVDHVVIFDFPKDPAEYVRRVGRTARAGRTGSSTVFAYGWQLPIARKVMGSKLDSFTIAANELQGKHEEDAYARKNNKSKDATIKANIEKSRLWE